MQLILTPDIENALKEQADKAGVTPQQLALESLRRLFVSVNTDADKKSPTLADFLDGYIGVLHSSEFVEGDAQLSEDTGKKFAELMRQKRNQDRL